MTSRRLSLLAALAASVTLLACGGGGDDDDDGADRLTASEFVSEADGICEQANTDNPLPEPPTNAQEAGEQALEEVRIRQQIHDDLAELEPPAEFDDAWDDYLSLSEEIIAAVQAQADNAEDLQAYQRASFDLNRLTIERGKIATELGFEICSQPAEFQQPLGDPELVEQADAACAEANEAILDAIPEDAPSGEPDLDALAQGYAESLPAGQGSLEALKQLEPPESDAAEWERFIDAYEERMAITARQKAAAEEGDQAAFEAASRDDSTAQAKEADAALKLGLAVCGANGVAGV